MPEITSYAPGAPSWVDLSTTDDKEALAFYGALFKWEDDPQEMGPDFFYHLQKINGLDVGGLSQQMEVERSQGVPPLWNTYLSVTNVDDTLAKVQQAGGALIAGPMDIFDAGRMAVLQDPQGATFSVWQAKEHLGCRVKNEPGALIWNELLTTNSNEARRFYSSVFGHTIGEMDGGYTLLRVDGTDVAGIMEITPEMGPAPPHWMPYFCVADVDASSKQAEALGAKVLVPGTDIPGIGRFATLQDPQGVAFSVFTPAEES